MDNLPQKQQAILAKRNPFVSYIASLTSDHSRDNMSRHLFKIASIVMQGQQCDPANFPWWELQLEDVDLIKNILITEMRYAPASVNVMLSALRGVFKYCRRHKLIDDDTYQELSKIENVDNDVLPKGRQIEKGEVLAILRICRHEKTPKGYRDAALIAVLYSGGFRRGELAKVSLADYSNKTGEIKVLHGKNRHQRISYLNNNAMIYLADWLELRGNDDGGLFCKVYRGGTIKPNSYITGQTIYDVITARASQADITMTITPHDFRRTLISNLFDENIDAVTIASQVGHKQITTTQKYDRRPESRKKQAVNQVDLPVVD